MCTINWKETVEVMARRLEVNVSGGENRVRIGEIDVADTVDYDLWDALPGGLVLSRDGEAPFFLAGRQIATLAFITEPSL